MKHRIGKDLDLVFFGEELKKLILSKGYKSLYDFHNQSAQTHISYTSLKDTVAGRIESSFSNLVNIANALEMTQGEFFNYFSYKYSRK